MVYTEVKERNGKKYFYRVRSLRRGNKFRKQRIYLGEGLGKEDLEVKEERADKKLLKNNIEKGLKGVRSKIVKILKKNKIKRAGIFGSFSRGEQGEDSDVDILIEPPKNVGFGFVGIVFELEDKLGRKVDLVSYDGIDSLLRNKILSQEIRII